MKKTNQCNLCGNKDLEFLFYAKDKNMRVPGKFPILKCKKCGLMMIGVIPDDAELRSFYPKEKYYSYKKIDSSGFKFRMRMLLYNMYFNKVKKNSFKKLLLFPFLPFSRGTIIEPGKKLLDIGSGSGQFLYEMKQFGINVYGLEPGDFDRNSAKKEKIEIKNTDLLKARYQNESFDIITLNHVLEHIQYPRGTIKEIYRILKKGGKMVIGVPNYKCLAYSIFGKNWYQLDVPRHFNDFSDKILVKILKEEGFRINKIRYNSRPTQFSVSLLYSVRINPKEHVLLANILNIFFMPLTYFVNSTKFGDQIEVFCSK